MKTIAIIGSRRRDSQKDFEATLKVFLSVYEYGDDMVSGGCPKGGDRFAEVIAKKQQIPIKIYYAQWNKLGKRAGFDRNTDIARDGDVIIAVVAPDRKGGTEDTIVKAEGLGKEILLVPFIEDPDGLLEDILPDPNPTTGL